MTNILTRFNRLLNGITMYKLVAGGLVVIALLAVVLRFFGSFNYASPATLALMFVIVPTVCYVSNILFGKLYRVPVNHESSAITGLILFLILAAPTNAMTWVGIVFAAIIAMASKYVVTWRGAAIFNPAAFGVFVVALAGLGDGAWWVASPALLIPVAILGLLILIKLRRFGMFLAFAVPALVMIVARTTGADMTVGQSLVTALTLYPVIFLGTVMLTEPGTMPDTQYKRLVYAGIVGLIFGSQLSTDFIATSPHVALLAGNLFAVFVSRRTSTRMELIEKKQLSPTTYEFIFKPERKIDFAAGQYMEFTLDGVKYNIRGNRRTFSIASGPTNPNIHIGIKFYEPGSAFKQKLSSLPVGSHLLANRVAGDFLLPHDAATPIVMIAGGIGITPFRSMLEDMDRTKQKRSVTLYYFAADADEIVYKDVLKRARDSGADIQLRAGSGKRLTDVEIGTMKQSAVYISGPPGLVSAYQNQLKAAGVSNVHTDYFTGY